MRRPAAILFGIVLLFAVSWVVHHFVQRQKAAKETYGTGLSVGDGRVEPQIAFGYSVGALLAPDGSIWVWGGTDAVDRPLIPSGKPTESPVRLGNGRNWVRIALSYHGLASIRRDGTLWFQGRQPDQSASLAQSLKFHPEQLVSDATNWTDIAAGTSHFVALKNDGTIWTWGDNQYGQLGDDTQDDGAVPAQIGIETNWSAVAAGACNSFALRADGTVWGWGMDLASFQSAARGIRNRNHMLTPQRLDAGANWVAISAAGYNGAALKSDGSIWVIGQGAPGLIGLNSTTNYGHFLPVGDETGWSSVSAGAVNLYATKADGSLWGLGVNHQGQLGQEDITWTYDWIPLSDAWCFGAGQGTVALLARDGTLWTQGVRLGAPMNSPSLVKRLGVWIMQKVARQNIALASPTYQQDWDFHKIWDMPDEMKHELSQTNQPGQP